MSAPLKLVIFDVDGTLVDSQAQILASMTGAFAQAGLPTPSREAILSIIGLSLPEAMARLCPEVDGDDRQSLVAGYKDSFAALRRNGDAGKLSPLYPGARAVVEALAAMDEVFLGIATGKSRRGLDHLLDLHGFRPHFHTTQVADDHPSKPHPSMVAQCLRDTGVDPAHAVIIGDTSYDMEMGRAAGIGAMGVTWGYHQDAVLRGAGAQRLLDRFEELPGVLEEMWDQA